jgi:hypothetical protein
MTQHTTFGTIANPIPIPIGQVANLASLPTPVLRAALRVQRGDSLDVVFRAYREVFGGPSSGCACDPNNPFGSGTSAQVLTGLQARAVVRRAKDHPQEWPLVVIVDQTGAGSPTRGIIRVTADASATRLFPDHGVWDLEVNDGTDTLRKTLVEGPLAFNRDVAL